jgi:hypothetical protein
MSFNLIWSRSHSLDSFSRCTALIPQITNSNIIEHGPKLVEAAMVRSLTKPPWKPGLMARKNNISKIGRATQIIVHAISDHSHFLPFTHNPKHDSGGRARQVRCFVVAPLLAPSLKKVRDSGIVFAVQFWEFTASFDRSIFLSFENTSNPSAVFS